MDIRRPASATPLDAHWRGSAPRGLLFPSPAAPGSVSGSQGVMAAEIPPGVPVHLAGHRQAAEGLKAAYRRDCGRIQRAAHRRLRKATIHGAQDPQRRLHQIDVVVALSRFHRLLGVQNGLHGLCRSLLHQLSLVGLHQALPGGSVHHPGGRQTVVPLKGSHCRHGVGAEHAVRHHRQQAIVSISRKPEE